MNVINSCDLIHVVRNTLNMIDTRLINHGDRVAYMLYKMLEYSGAYSQREMLDRCILAMLHDVGAYKTDEINDMLAFETKDAWNHSIYGYLFVHHVSPLRALADGILFHHLDYELFDWVDCKNPALAQMIKLTDRLDVFTQGGRGLDWTLIEERRGSWFNGDYMDLFLQADARYHIWEKLADGSYEAELFALTSQIELTEAEIRSYLQMLSYTIDFRSEYTVCHTITTIAISVEIARLMKLDEATLRSIYYGATLHDLGKITIPIEILEYPGKLSFLAMEVMKSHVASTANIIKGYVDPVICEIALRHHEKIDGSGYPCGLTGDMLTLPEKIVAVADIVSALSGKRSYKDVFSKETIIGILSEMRVKHKIDPEVTEIAIAQFDVIVENANQNFSDVLCQYNGMRAEYDRLLNQYGGLISEYIH